MHTAGGRVSTVIDGVSYSARGVITLDPSNIEVSVESNSDGSNYRTVKAKPRMASITFDRFVDQNGRPMRWDEGIMLRQNIPFTFIEQDTNVTHLLTNGCFTGKPEMDLSTGEVSGVGIAADKYETI